MDRPIASDLSYECLQRRRRLAQLTTPQLHERLGVSYLLVQQRPVVLDAHPADRVIGMSEQAWDALRLHKRFSER